MSKELMATVWGTRDWGYATVQAKEGITDDPAHKRYGVATHADVGSGLSARWLYHPQLSGAAAVPEQGRRSADCGSVSARCDSLQPEGRGHDRGEARVVRLGAWE